MISSGITWKISFSFFEHDNIEAYSLQLTRDAELDLDKEVSEKFIDALSKSLQKRKKGTPMRLLYDTEMPHGYVKIPGE
jgi:polyphosphate kinase